MTQLALIKDGVFVEAVADGRGFNLPNGDRVSPAVAGWSNDDGYSLALIADADAVPDGKIVVGAAIELVDGAWVWVQTLEDEPEAPLLPIPRRDFFKIALREFNLTRDGLRTVAGDTAAQAVAAAGGDQAAQDLAREDAYIDFDEASEIHRDNPLFLAMLDPAGLTTEQADAAWRNWQATL